VRVRYATTTQAGSTRWSMTRWWRGKSTRSKRNRCFISFRDPRLAPILDAIRLYHELGVWVEVTTLVIPGLNDSDDELTQIAAFIHSVDPAIPWHVTQYYPTYRMLDRPPTPVATVRRAREIGKQIGLRYVYEGDVNTYCYQCQALLIGRFGFYVGSNRIKDGCSPHCGARIDGIGMSGA